VSIRTVVVDDEALARSRLRKFLLQEPGVEIIGECANGPEAIALVGSQATDLLFLDVQMPEVSGFDVLTALPPERVPLVIFVTAHDQHAISAFEVRALDYLLKPFTQARLQEAVRRARRQLESQATAEAHAKLMDLLKAPPSGGVPLSRIAVKNGPQTLFVRLEDLDFIEAAANYSVLHARGGNHVLRETLTSLENRLPPSRFLRISRSTIVSLDRVKAIQAGPKGEHLVLLQDGRQLVMTRGIQEAQKRLQYPGVATII